MLFDLDGTLTDPKEGITKCVQYALKACGIEVSDLDKLVCFIGPPLLESFMRYYDLDEPTARFAIEKYRERFSTVGLFENRAFDGISELLKSLKVQGRTLAVATSKPEVYAKRILDKYELSGYFDNICGSELDGRRVVKYDVIEEVLRRLNVADRSDVLMIGDRHHDIDAAKQSGIASCGVEFGYAEPGELKAAGADYIADTVSGLRKILCNI